MKTNFEIEENYAVQLNGIHIDLHNNFEFKTISESENIMQIEFIKSKGDWIQANEFERLKFIHHNVNFIESFDGDNSEFPEDENTLSVIAFSPKTIRDTKDGFMLNSKPNENDDIIYIFQNDKIFRINCEWIELIAEK